METDADYPSHRTLIRYFRDFADHFGLTEHFRFDTRVTAVEQTDDGGWMLRAEGPEGAIEQRYAGVILANGTLAEPNVPTFRGEFTGELLHTSAYKSAEQLTGRRVLIIGAGNSGCDIAVDAVHHAASVDMSVRRGYYFVPRYLFGRPVRHAEPGQAAARAHQAVRRHAGPAGVHGRSGALRLPQAGLQALRVAPDRQHADPQPPRPGRPARSAPTSIGSTGEPCTSATARAASTTWCCSRPATRSTTRSSRAMSSTGAASRPTLYLNVFPPSFNGLYVMGMIEASGIGWQGRYEQAELIAEYLSAVAAPSRARRGLPSSRRRRALARPHRRLPVPGPRAHVVLRQQGRLPPRGAVARPSACGRSAAARARRRGPLRPARRPGRSIPLRSGIREPRLHAVRTSRERPTEFWRPGRPGVARG